MTKVARRVKAYTKEDLELALLKIKKGMPIKRASITFQIPRGTLQNRVHNRTKKSLNCSGPPPVLSEKEEKDIAHWVRENARKGFPRRETDLLFVVKEFLDANPRENPFTDNMPGRTWYKNFRRRHPRISLRTPEAVSSASSKVSESDIRRWFKHVKDYLEENDLLNVLQDPSRSFNSDETSFLLCPKTGRVLAPKGMQNVYEIDQGTAKEAITTLFTFSADGRVLTPLIVYPYVRIPNDIRESVPDNFAIDKSETGWMNQEIFYDYIKNTFHPDLVKNNVEFPVILFVDGHKSHLSYKLSELCTDLKIILICLPPNATRIVQPADVSCFKPVKTGWENAITIWRRKNVDKMLTKVRFAKILKIVIANCIDPTTIKSGFRACGLSPFDPNAVDYTKCLGKNWKTNIEENETTGASNDRNVIDALSFTTAIDLQRFREIVGEAKLLALTQFNHEMPCSSDFLLLHQIYEELSVPNVSTASMSDETLEQGYLITDDEDMTAEQLVEPITPSKVPIVHEGGKTEDEVLIDDNSVNQIDLGVISMDDVILVDQKEVVLQDFLTVPGTPVRKGKNKKVNRERQFVMTSELYKMEERIKIEEKIAKEKALVERRQQLVERKRKLEERKQKQEEKKQQLAENKAKKQQLDEIKKLETVKKAAEKEEKNRKRAADREEKQRGKEEKKKKKVQTKKSDTGKLTEKFQHSSICSICCNGIKNDGVPYCSACNTDS